MRSLMCAGRGACGPHPPVPDPPPVAGARAGLLGQDRLAAVADIGGVLDMERPALAGPPDHRAAAQVVAGEDLHASASAALAQAASLSSASAGWASSRPERGGRAF